MSAELERRAGAAAGDLVEGDAPKGNNGTIKIDGRDVTRNARNTLSQPTLDVLRQLDFMKVLEACVDKLPGQQGRLFMMREWLELETDEICKELSITSTNLWVMLHRARGRLRSCLEERWFTP